MGSQGFVSFFHDLESSRKFLWISCPIALADFFCLSFIPLSSVIFPAAGTMVYGVENVVPRSIARCAPHNLPGQSYQLAYLVLYE